MGSQPPSLALSFIVPAHNEEALIADTVSAIGAAAREAAVGSEIIVVDDASGDATAALARQAGARVVSVHFRHIAAARNAGAAVAVGGTLVFVDADTRVTGAVICSLIDACRRGAIGGGAVVTFDQQLPRYVRVWAALFTWLSRRLGLAAGCFVFCAANEFAAMGGFDERYFAAEEIVFSRAAKRRGRFVILETPVVTSARKIRTHSGAEICGTFLKLLLRPSAVKRRSALPLWYGPRRPDC
jgi:glycosyltransferase involved in cell wall biosynthesis